MEPYPNYVKDVPLTSAPSSFSASYKMEANLYRTIKIAAQEQRSIKIPTIQTFPFMATRVKCNNRGVAIKLIEDAYYSRKK